MPEVRRFKKGDFVQFKTVSGYIQGIVKEDRGPIGIKGRHLYVVEYTYDENDVPPRQVELPAVDLKLVVDVVAKK